MTVLKGYLEKWKGRLYASPYTIAELYNTVYRKVAGGDLKLAEPLAEILSGLSADSLGEAVAELVLAFVVKKLSLKIIDDPDVYTGIDIHIHDVQLILPRLFHTCIELSPKTRIRIKDLLHVAYVKLLKDKYGIEYLVTCDAEDFDRVREVLKELGVQLVVIG